MASLASKEPRNASRGKKKKVGGGNTPNRLPKSIVNEMLERIKRVKKTDWLFVLLMAIGTINGKISILKCICWVVVIGYLVWKMSGDE